VLATAAHHQHRRQRAQERREPLIAIEIAADEARRGSSAAKRHLRKGVFWPSRKDRIHPCHLRAFVAAHGVRLAVREHDHVVRVEPRRRAAGALHDAGTLHEDVKQDDALGIGHDDVGEQRGIRRIERPGRRELRGEEHRARQPHDAYDIG
jgi:hypothetical protein